VRVQSCTAPLRQAVTPTAPGVDMTRYASVWLGVTCTLGAVGVAAAWTAWTPSAVAMVFTVGFTMGATVMSVVHILGRPVHTARVLGVGAKTGVAVVAAGGLTVPLGVAILPALLIVAVCSPRVVVWLLYRGGPAALADAGTSGQPLEADRLMRAEEAGLLSDRALCRAWRKSYFDLTRSQSLPASLRIVQERQGYLDELERRSPHGLSAWLSSGARAAGNPSRYIDGGKRHPRV
jgi:hypothetical protein